MGKFDPRSLDKATLDRAVRDGTLSSYYLDGNTLVKEIAMRNGGYVLKLIEYLPGTKKEHAQADYIYDSNGKLIDHKIHNF